MTESNDVLFFMKIVYMTYLTIIFILFGWFGWSLQREGKPPVKLKKIFYSWIILLVIIGVGIHITTYLTLPWIKWDLNRHDKDFAVDKEFKIKVSDHKFHFPDNKKVLHINKGDMVRFDLISSDLMYGFGLFRKDGTMLFQMQVNPMSRNDIVWKFDKEAVYTIRSTEYSGPRGGSMVVRDSVIVK